MTETDHPVCSLCGSNFPSKQALTHHIHQHLLYRKYECASCSELFYTEEEREVHCKKKAHFHTFGMRVSPYCELYVSQFLKDIEHIVMYGIDAVVMLRSKSSLALTNTIYRRNIQFHIFSDTAILKLPRKGNTPKRKPSGSSPMLSKACKLQDSSSAQCSSVIDQDKEASPNSVSQNLSNQVRNRNRIPSDDWMRIEVDNSSAMSSASHLLSEALRTTTPEVRCMICKAMTPFEYVMRKHHVSSVHMPKDHTESDYFEILSTLMQKAYPAMTYNDLQCQIGGCRKEYKCQSARRTHVLRIHFQNELNCPLKLCSFRSNDFSRINSHLKEDHNLPNGYMSIQSTSVRDQFNSERAKHNHRLTTLVQLAFPCPVPESCKPGSRLSETNSPGETVHGLITRIRDKDRKFQAPPPKPLRLRSPTSSSDSDSSESEKSPKSPVLQVTSDSINGSTNKKSTPSKALQVKSKTSSEQAKSRNSSSTSSSGSDSEDEKNASEINKIQPLRSVNGTTAKRKKEKDIEVIGSDIDSMWNNASDKSDSSSDSGDDIQLVECLPKKSGNHGANKEIVIEEVMLDDDDDDEMEATSTPSGSKPSPSVPTKEPKIRTLPISGVSVRTDGKRVTPTGSAISEPSDGALSRTLPISGVSVRTGGTPIRPHTDTYRKSFPNGGRIFAKRHSSAASEQLERRRELARRKFDLAEQKRAQCIAKRKMNVPPMKFLSRGTPKSSRKHKKVKNQKPLLNEHCEPLRIESKSPSYTVAKIKGEMPTPLSGSPCTSNAWRGKVKRFDD